MLLERELAPCGWCCPHCGGLTLMVPCDSHCNLVNRDTSGLYENSGVQGTWAKEDPV